MKSDKPYETNVDSAHEAISGVNTNFIAKKANICQPGQDEIFDNCSPPDDSDEEAQEAAEEAAANPTNEQIGSRTYGNAALDFLSGVNNEFDRSSGNFIGQGQGCACIPVCVQCACECPEEEIPLPDDPEKAQEVVQERVRKERAKADEKIEKIVEKEETKKDGLIDLMSKTLAKNAKTRQEITDNRTDIESMVKTRIAAATELGTQVRGALSAGLKATNAK